MDKQIEIPAFLRSGEQIIDINMTPFEIGSYDGICKLVIEGKDIAPIHCRILFEKDAWQIEDLKGLGGVIINGDLMDPGSIRALSNGDQIQIGSKVYTFVLKSPLFSDGEVDAFEADYREVVQAGNRDSAKQLIAQLWHKIEQIDKVAGDGIEADVNGWLADIFPSFAKPFDETAVQPESEREEMFEPEVVETEEAIEKGEESALKQQDDAAEGPDDVESKEAQPMDDGISSNEPLDFVVNRDYNPFTPETSEDEPQMPEKPAETAKPKVSLADRRVSISMPEDREIEDVEPEVPAAQPICSFSSLDRDIPSFNVYQTPFVIGLRNACDYQLNCRGVSRNHAKIIRDDNNQHLLICDNSTNGTYVNDRMIGRGKEARLHTGDIVMFYDKKFIVKISEGKKS